MEVIKEKEHTDIIMFKDISYGDVFAVNDMYFIKTNDVVQENINAIDTQLWIPYYFEASKIVRRVNAKLLIKD